MSDVPPSDLEAEESVLGAMLLSQHAIESVIDSLTAPDFYRPAHGLIYDTIMRLHMNGTKADAVTVGDALRGSDLLAEIGGSSTLISLMANTPNTSAARHYAEIIMNHSLRRRLVGEARELIEQASDLSLDVGDVLESHQALVATLGSAIIDHEPDDVSVEEFMQRPKDMMSPWVVHGIVRRRHKLILVGAEGGSKSWLLRFIAICAAYGIQPFRHEREKPVKTLIIDLENPEDALFDSFEAILKQVVAYSPQEATVNRLWWKPAGINLRNRVDAAEMENVIRVRRPDLVCLGPLYAAYENNSADFGWETAAREVQNFLKKLMVRYDFALMIEDHAPQADGTGKRVMRPYGSSFWRRWPDIGLGLEALDDRTDAFKVTRWRGDRVPTDWPKMIEWGSATGSPWPFRGFWDEENNDRAF